MDEQSQTTPEEEKENVLSQEAATEAPEGTATEAPEEETQKAPEGTATEAPEEETQKAPEPTPEEVALAKAAVAEEKYLRLMAEFDNYRKRMAKEASETRERARISVVNDFLPVYDFFQMAMAHSAQNPDVNVLKQGMEMIFREFGKTFDTLGLKEIPAVGKPFDPHVHEAARSEASDTVAEGIIISQWKAGYKIGENLVRPAMVVVSSGKPAPAPEAAENQSGTASEIQPDTEENKD